MLMVLFRREFSFCDSLYLWEGNKRNETLRSATDSLQLPITYFLASKFEFDNNPEEELSKAVSENGLVESGKESDGKKASDKE
ncbi:hypothetical protein RIF29_14691 [Crotalaria pallida]|uniref:Uncharacterized protein n=1 Tax=Crotalaria pallida TaxID=3830 RepID=A0AAN9FDU9_CROPI